MDISKAFGTNKKAEYGVGVKIPMGEDGYIVLQRAGGANREYLKRVEELRKKYRLQAQINALPEEESKRLLAEVYADTIVLDWKIALDGEDLPYSRENVIRGLMAEENFFQWVKDLAEDMENFRNVELEHDAGNSESGFGGS